MIDALQSMVTSYSWMYGTLCLGDATSESESASAIFMGTNHCYISVQYSKSKTGMPIDPGTSIMLYFTDINLAQRINSAVPFKSSCHPRRCGYS